MYQERDRHEFRLLRRALGLSLTACARAVGVTPRTVSLWEAGRVGLPYAPYRLLRLLAGAELPGAQWQGFRVVGDRIYTPEGHHFCRADLAWWLLTCRQAEAFR